MTLALILALICYIVYRALSGADNGLLYSRGLSPYPWIYQKYGVHEIEVIQTSVVLLGFWAAGLDAVQLAAGWFVASPFFKGFINLGTGRPFIDPDETGDVDQDGTPGYRLFGISLPVLGHGYGRVILAVVGLVIIILWPWVMYRLGLSEHFPFSLTECVTVIKSFFE